MPDKRFDIIKMTVLSRLKNLDTNLTYHNIRHTLDVLNQAERIAEAENIKNERTVFLLKLAALYHDTGFLETYEGHEEMSCRIFRMDSENMDLKEEEKKLVLQLIMVTKSSNEPLTHLQKIICDADLDYLGRDDFSAISEGLKIELLCLNKIADGGEWQQRQLNFLKNHQYYTQSSLLLREPAKQKNYQSLLS